MTAPSEGGTPRPEVVATALRKLRDYPDGSYMRCPFCGAKSSRHHEDCAVDIVERAITQGELDRQYHMSAINRLARAVGALGETSEDVVSKAILGLPSAIAGRRPPRITIERLEHWAKEIHGRQLEDFERRRVADLLLDAALDLREKP